MHVLMDHLAAVVIAGTVLLILIAAQHGSQRAAAEATGFYMQKQQQMTFVETLRMDMQGVSRLVTIEERAADTSFVFYAQTAATDTAKHEVTYRRTRVGRRDGVDLYQVQRFVGGQRAGASPGTVTGWRMVARNEQGGGIQRPNDARQVYVRFEMVPPVRNMTALPRTRWEATFHPPLLNPDRF